MATTTIKIGKQKSVERFCPECGSKFLDPTSTTKYIICTACAAICIYDSAKTFYRMLQTQEWLDVCCEPGFYDLIETRHATLERITTPDPVKKAR